MSSGNYAIELCRLRSRLLPRRTLRQEVLGVIRRNRDLLRSAVADWPGVYDNALEATYLQWLEVSELGYDNPQKAFEDGGVGLNEATFGDANCVRVNLATQLDTMQEIIRRMDKVVRAAPGKQG